MPDYKLLTPGPLTTTDTVKREMLFDHCTWDEDYKQITRKIRRELLRLAHAPEETYTVVLMQGSGTFGVESVVGSSLGDEQKASGLRQRGYGERMAEIARRMGKKVSVYRKTMTGFRTRGGWLRYWRRIRKLPMWHDSQRDHIRDSERYRSSGESGEGSGKTFIVDAMSSFAGVDIDVPEIGMDF